MGSAEDFRSLLLEYYRPYKTKWYRIHDDVRSRSIIAVHGVSERISRAIDNWVNKNAKLIDIVSA
jgi:hypothetical protein